MGASFLSSIKKTQSSGDVRRRDGFDNRDNPFHYILAAINLTESYAHELGRELGVYHLGINSELDSADGKNTVSLFSSSDRGNRQSTMSVLPFTDG